MGKIVSRSFSGIAGHGEWVLSVGIAHTRTIGASATCPLHGEDREPHGT
jgi:hypothetical protein